MTRHIAVVSQNWPVAGGGNLFLSLFADAPSADAIRLLGPVVGAIEAYQSAMAELVHPNERRNPNA